MSGRICCCLAPTAGAVSISLQLVFGSVGLACACLALSRFPPLSGTGADEALPMMQTRNYTPIVQNFSVPTLVRWFDVAIQLSSTIYVAFASVWIFTLLIACLTFRYYRPVLMLPDLVVCYVGVAMNGVQCGVILIRLLLDPPENRLDDYGDVVLVYLMFVFMTAFLANFLFILLSQRYYSSLVKRYGSISPASKAISTRKVLHQAAHPASDTTRVEYKEEA